MDRRTLRRGLLIAVVAVFLQGSPASADSRPAALETTLTPTALPLAPGEGSTAVLVLRNVSDERIDHLAVRPLNPPSGVHVSQMGTGLTTRTLDPGSSTSVSMRVTRATEGVADDIPFQIDIRYEQVGIDSPSPGMPPAPTIDQRTVAVGTVKAAAQRDLLIAQFDGQVDPVSEDRHGTATLLLQNPRPQSVTLKALEVTSPRSLTLLIDDVADPPVEHGQTRFERGSTRVEQGQTEDVLADVADDLELAGRSSLVVPIDLEADAQLDPGGRLIVVRATVEQDGVSADVVTSQAVQVEVFGESEILGALGVPMIFLLPGLIILVVAAFLITRLSPWRRVLESGRLDIAAKATLGAVLSVGVSLIVLELYPTLTGIWPNDARDLRAAYGFADFQYIYTWSFVLAVLVWLLALPLLPAWRWAFVPEIGNTAPTVLRKLAWRRWPAKVELLVVDGIDEPNLGADGPELGGKRFTFPPLYLRGTPLDSRSERDLRDALENGRLFRAWRLVRKATRQKGAKVEYASTGYVNRPMMVDPDTVRPNGQQTFVVDTP